MSSLLAIRQNRSPATALANLEKARQLLAEARTLPEIKKIRGIAEAARAYAKAAKLGKEAQNYAAEIALLAAQKAGAILKQLRRGKPGPKGLPARLAANSEYSQTLKETNTPERTAQYWQELAGVPEPTVQKYIELVRQAEKPTDITAAGLLRFHPRETSPNAQKEDRSSNTINGYPLYEVKSAFQKSIRRGLEDSLFWAREYVLSKKLNSLWDVLRVISSEDIGFGDPSVALQVRGLFENWKELQNEDLIVYAVLISMQAKKSRLIDDAFCAIHNENQEELDQLEKEAVEANKVGEEVWPYGNEEKTISTLRSAICKKDEEKALKLTDQIDTCGHRKEKKAQPGGNVEDSYISDVAAYGKSFWKCILNLSDAVTAPHLRVLYENWKDSKQNTRHRASRIFMVHAVLLLIRTESLDLQFRKPDITDARRVYKSHKPKLEVPDWALDGHTSRGFRMGRGKDTVEGAKFFYDIGALLINPAPIQNPYADRARASAIAVARKKESEVARNEETKAASNRNSPMHKVTDQVFVGSQRAVPLLEKNNPEAISHILNCTERAYEAPQGMTLHTLSMPDNSECDPAIVRRGVKFIRRAVSRGGKVLVHCRGGVSRSRALVAAYLHLHHEMTWQEAKAEVLRKRPIGGGINKKVEASVLSAFEGIRGSKQRETKLSYSSNRKIRIHKTKLLVSR